MAKRNKFTAEHYDRLLRLIENASIWMNYRSSMIL